MKEESDKLFVKIKSFCSVKDDIKQLKKFFLKLHIEIKHFQITHLTKDLYLKYIKNFQSSSVRIQTTHFKNGQKT